MSSLCNVRGQNVEIEQELLRKTAAARLAARLAVEREQRIIAESRTKVEAEIEAKEAELQACKEKAQGFMEQAEQCEEVPSASENCAELEDARAAVQKAQEQLQTARQGGVKDAEAQRERLDEARGVYQMYAAATGIRWDYNKEHVAGYVALGQAKHFDFGEEPELPGAGDDASAAEKLWREVEAALPPASEISKAPWEMSRSPAGPGGA